MNHITNKLNLVETSFFKTGEPILFGRSLGTFIKLVTIKPLSLNIFFKIGIMKTTFSDHNQLRNQSRFFQKIFEDQYEADIKLYILL